MRDSHTLPGCLDLECPIEQAWVVFPPPRTLFGGTRRYLVFDRCKTSTHLLEGLTQGYREQTVGKVLPDSWCRVLLCAQHNSVGWVMGVPQSPVPGHVGRGQ